MLVSLDGALVRVEDARVSPLDRGLLVGDAVFETLRAYAGRTPDLARHLARLARSCSLTGLPAPPADLAKRVEQVLAANGLEAVDAAVRVTITAGVGGAGVSRRGAGAPTILVTAQPVAYREEQYREGVAAVVARSTRRMPASVLDPRVKATSYLPNVLARREAEERGAFEALLLNERGEVTEATTANVLAVLDGELATPPLDAPCLDGLTRERVLALAREDGFAVAERVLLPSDLAAADEILLTASVAEVLPVTTFEGAGVGLVRPGPVARRLRERYRADLLARG